MTELKPNKRGCKPQFDTCLIHRKPLRNKLGCDEQRPLAPAKDLKIPPMPVENDVYHRGKADKTMRRVVAVRDGRVCYSTGSNTNRWCNVRTFLMWLRSPLVKKVHDGAT